MDRVLIVDDDKAIVHMVSEFMKVYGIDVITAYSGETALNKIDNSISLILLDINMKGINGLELCKIIRERTKVPIIFLTANSSQYDKVLGLGVGGDDYVTKPFDIVELIARVQAHIRRYKEYGRGTKDNSKEIVQFGNIKIIKDSRRVLRSPDKEVNLTSTEYNLLLYLVENPGKVLSRRELLNNVWKSDMYDENTVTTYIKRLREKLEDGRGDGGFIRSVRGIGYVFEMK